MTVTPDLLLLRLDALKLDISKVRAAVDEAEKRGQFLQQAYERIRKQKRALNAVAMQLDALVQAMDDDGQIAVLLDETMINLDRDLRRAPGLVETVIEAVDETVTCLRRAMSTTVTLEDDRVRALQKSLGLRCDELDRKLLALRAEVAASPPNERRVQWIAYQELLDGVARPVFVEYVDFLGGLTVRDTGLDDQVCEMTDALLTRFKSVTQRSLPLPARQAALGNALDSVVLLGFPEWSIWGIPLVAHEVGLSYARNRNEDGPLPLVQRFAKPGGGDEEYVHQLLADAFATYALGLSYACAALLLRLSPRHDEPFRPDRPRDIDRARVIMMTLNDKGSTAPKPGGSFSDAVGDLQEIWELAVRAHAGPADAEAAALESRGPSAAQDWLDDLTQEAVEHFRGRIRSYDNDRWKASEAWLAALRDQTIEPGWAPVDDAVPDVLTAAWRLRLQPGTAPVKLAADVKQRWSDKRRGA